MEKDCLAILNKPKPKVEPPKEPEPAKQQAPPPTQAQGQIDDEHLQPNGEQKQQADMEVD